MNKLKKSVKIAMLGALLMVGVGLSGCKSNNKSVSLKGDYTAYLQGNDWGENLSQITVHLNQKVDGDSLNKKDFKITEVKDTFDWTKPDKGVFEVKNPRTIQAVYISDKTGKKVKDSSEYVTFKMGATPYEGRYYFLSPDAASSQYPEKYELNIKLQKDAKLTSEGNKVEKLTVSPKIKSLKTDADQFKVAKFHAKDNVDYQYAYFEPKEKSDTLVVWLHGLLEGGSKNTDPYITLLSNKARILADEPFQKTIGNANVLVPQCPSFWMDKSGKDELVNGKIVSDGTSYYLDSLHELIQSYKEKVGAKKVLIAGCSNGGYMGMLMAKTYGKEYDGYMLICEAMEDRFLSDSDIQKLKDLPLYFVYSKDDPTVIPSENEEPTIARLKAAGAKNVQVAHFEHIVDQTGKIKDEKGQPYDFGGHSSWVYFFDNAVNTNDTNVNAWEWLAAQVK